MSDPILPFRTKWHPDIIFVCRSISHLKKKTEKLSVNTGCYSNVLECLIFYVAYYVGVPRHFSLDLYTCKTCDGRIRICKMEVLIWRNINCRCLADS